jgi:hypothetical protein
LGKKLLEQYPWQNFEPHPEWASFATAPPLSFAKCQWIWFPEGNPAQNAPAAKRHFRRAFDLPNGATFESARIRLSADDRFTAKLNGRPVGSSSEVVESWRVAREFDNIRALLKAGRNVLTVEAENLPSTGANPAGLIARIEISLAGAPPLNLNSDDTWRVAQNAPTGWDAVGFDDSQWSKAMKIADYGGGPWGNIDHPPEDEFSGPQATGITGGVRIVYVPLGHSVRLHHLLKDAVYSASIFDPVTGDNRNVPAVRSDQDGRWTCPPPAGHDHDWVLILDPRR